MDLGPSAIRRRSDGVATIAMDRPEARNALSDELLDDLLAAFAQPRATTTPCAASCSPPRTRRSSPRAATSKGFTSDAPLVHKHFATDRFVAPVPGRSARSASRRCAPPTATCSRARSALALACDLIVAKESARFGTPEINVGVFPFMIMALIYRNVGRKKTNELLLLGEQISAAEAERIGIVNRVVPDDEFDAAVADWAGKLAAKSPLLMRLGKDAMYRQQDMALRRRARVPARAARARVLDRRHPGGRAAPSSRSGSRCGPAAERHGAALPDVRPHARRRARRRGARARAGPATRAWSARSASRGSPTGRTTCATRTAACSRPAARSRTCWRPARFPVLTASDCSICMTTFQAVVRHAPGRARAVAGRARRLQHARHDAERVPRRHVPGAPRAGAGTRASSRRSTPRAC